VLTKTAIAVYYEATWRQKADRNSKLKFLNVQTTGLAGRPHPLLLGVLTTQEVMRSMVQCWQVIIPATPNWAVTETWMHSVVFVSPYIHSMLLL
jgi:hypothetical protein